MKISPKTAIWGLGTLLFVIIIAQNLEPTSLDILFWSLPSVPKLVLILGSMLFGFCLALPLWFRRSKKGKSYSPDGRNTYTPE